MWAFWPCDLGLRLGPCTEGVPSYGIPREPAGGQVGGGISWLVSRGASELMNSDEACQAVDLQADSYRTSCLGDGLV